MNVEINKSCKISFTVSKEELSSFILSQVNKALELAGEERVDSLDHLSNYYVYVTVPGGGDYSSTDLSLLEKVFGDPDVKINVSLEKKT